MLYLKHVFGLFTLQTSTVLFSSLFMTLAVCICSANVLSVGKETLVAWIIMFLFNCYVFTVWSVAFSGAYKESGKCIYVAKVMWSVYIIIWIMLVVWSFADTRNKNICLDSRCPNGLWMMDEFPPDESGGNVPNIKRTTAGRSVYEIRNIDGTDDDTTGPYKRNVSPPSNLSSGVDYGYDATAVNDKFTGTLPTRKSPESLIALGTLSSLYAVIILFSWLVLISYGEEMRLQANLTK